MTLALPPLPDRGLLADLCREVGVRESVQPYLVEKDFYLTRLLWALGQRFGEGLLLKGGTLLSKIDLGFFRMSEDADLVIPGEPSRNKGSNMRRINKIRDALKEIESAVGMKRRFPGGEDAERGSHRRWELDAPPLDQQPQPLGLTPQRRRELDRGVRTELPAVLRATAPAFDLDRMLARFERMWSSSGSAA